MIEPTEEMIEVARWAINAQYMIPNRAATQPYALAKAALTAAIPLIAARVAESIADEIAEMSYASYDTKARAVGIARSYTEGQSHG